MPLPFEEIQETYAGSRLFIKAGRPATNTEADWETFFGTGAKEITITSVPSFGGREYSDSSISVVSDGRNRRAKGEFNYPNSDFPVLWLPDQPGQVEALAASESYGQYSLALVGQLDDVRYATGQVSTFMETGGGNNDTRVGTMTFLRQSDVVYAATPVVPVEDDE